MAFLGKAKKQDLVLLAEVLGQKVSDKITIIDLKNIIIDSKDYEEEFVEAYLSVISEERVEREEEEKISRQHAIEQYEFVLEKLRLESELHKLRLETEVFGQILDGSVVQKILRRRLQISELVSFKKKREKCTSFC
ncbi:hypothetical protein TNCV_4107761 [Trichonephila clavipes]|nr:hypothetical protein TNCV_4107761 [Trichonephila clavipes]